MLDISAWHEQPGCSFCLSSSRTRLAAGQQFTAAQYLHHRTGVISAQTVEKAANPCLGLLMNQMKRMPAMLPFAAFLSSLS